MTRFINENEVMQLNYNMTHRCVEVWPKGDIMGKPQYYMVEDVVRVRYVSEGHDCELDSAADEVAELKKKLENATFRGNKLSECCTILRNFCIDNLLKVVREDGSDIYDMVENQWNDVCDKLRKRMEEIAEREEG